MARINLEVNQEKKDFKDNHSTALTILTGIVNTSTDQDMQKVARILKRTIKMLDRQIEGN